MTTAPSRSVRWSGGPVQLIETEWRPSKTGSRLRIEDRHAHQGRSCDGIQALDNNRQAPHARRACAGSRLWITTAKLPTRAAGRIPGSGADRPARDHGRSYDGIQALDNHRQAPQARRACAGSRLWIPTAKPPMRAAGTGSRLWIRPPSTARRDPGSGSRTALYTRDAAGTGSRLWIRPPPGPKAPPGQRRGNVNSQVQLTPPAPEAHGPRAPPRRRHKAKGSQEQPAQPAPEAQGPRCVRSQRVIS